jgi:hypothetical protein
MTTPPRGGRRVAWLVATLGASALALASCGTTPVAAPPHVSGTPALSISVPLSNVGCTRNDVCVASGTSSESLGVSAVAEFSSPKGHWFNLTLPVQRSPLLDATACSGTQCLLGGSRPGGDLLWSFNAKGNIVTVATPPPGGIGIDALTCGSIDCALVDTSALGDTPRLSVSDDAGATWSPPLEMAWAKGDAVTAFACDGLEACVVGALSPSHVLSLYVTEDGGNTWTQRATPSTWTGFTSLSCVARDCVALVNENDTSTLVRSTTFTRTWKSVTLGQQANALACTSTECYVVGEHSDDSAWLATEHDKVVTNVKLRYVPTSLLQVACGSKVCAAIGVTTLLSLPSPL